MGTSFSTEKLSAGDIFVLQDYFLKPGFHSLPVDSFAEGRTLVHDFLRSFPHLRRVAYLSLVQRSLNIPATSLYDELAFAGALSLSHAKLEQYLLECFHYDFLWIELDEVLEEAAWYTYLEYKLVQFNISSQIPILLLATQRV